MKLSDVRTNLKKDTAQSFYVIVHRKIGIIITWVLINLFPSVSPNLVTISMIPLNIMSSVLVYLAVVQRRYELLAFSFLVLFFSATLDCVDGNLARIKGATSVRGVLLDRLVHNVSNPMFFIILGFALYNASNQMHYLILFLVTGIISELSPLDVALKDTEASFIRQSIFRVTRNFSADTHFRLEKLYRDDQSTVLKEPSFRSRAVRSIFSLNTVYFMLAFDLLLLDGS